jgi:Ca2+-binding RTX toxin-like protein
MSSIEPLEGRTFFAAAPVVVTPTAQIVDGMLQVSGVTKAANVITLSTEDAGNTVVVQFNGGSAPLRFAKADIVEIDVAGGKKGDRITVTETDGLLDVSVTLRGGDGNDTIHLDQTRALVRGGNGRDTLYGSTGDDNLKGDEGDDRIYGGDGDDKLYGGDGKDRLEGEGGEDTLNGEAGNDTVKGGHGDDELRGGKDKNVLQDDNGDNVFYGSSQQSNGRSKIEGRRGDDYREIDLFSDTIRFD